MKLETDDNHSEIINNKKKVVFILISNSISNFLNEITVRGSFSNADLLLLLDDIIDSLQSTVVLQINQLTGEFEDDEKSLKPIIDDVVRFFEDQIAIKKEKIATKITKMSFVLENTVYKSITQLEKEFKSVVSKTLFELTQNLKSYH